MKLLIVDDEELIRNVIKEYAKLENYEVDEAEDGDAAIETIKTDYRNEITIFEDTQEKVFNTWFELIKGQLSGDVAGNLQNAIDETKERLRLIEGMCLTNDFIAPLATDDETLTVITDDLGNAILADWKYKEE